MSSDVRAFQPVSGPTDLLHELFVADPHWLPDAERLDGGRWAMNLHGGGFTRTVTAHLGQPWSAKTTLWRSLSWDPVRKDGPRSGRFVERLLPTFDGELGLHLADPATSLVLDGRYQPPGGELGASLDEIALHRLAQNTVQRLLADIAVAFHEHLAADPQATGAPSPEDDTRER